MEHGESLSNESTPRSTFKAVLYSVLTMGGVTIIALIAAILFMMHFSFGDNMWSILLKLKIGPGP